MEIREKKNRLDNSFYIGRTIVCFTLCIEKRIKIFSDPKIVSVFQNILLETAKRYKTELIIYLFMPDHLHLLLQGKSEDADCLKMINMFKQKTGYWLRQENIKGKWQKDYYDHIIKHDKDTLNQVFYILNNPVRAEIVDDYKSYPYKGSTVMNIDEIEFAP